METIKFNTQEKQTGNRCVKATLALILIPFDFSRKPDGRDTSEKRERKKCEKFVKDSG